MISISNLEFRYPRSDFLLRVDELEIEQGAKIAIVGPSGSGKTTLLNLLSGIVVADHGQVVVAGVNVTEFGDVQRRGFRVANIGLVFQQFELVQYLSVVDNIVLPYLISSELSDRKGATVRARELAERMGIGDKLKRFPSQLSQGEQQRVAICRALVADPKLILADEPTGNLDPKNKDAILQLMFESCEQDNKTLLVVTHDMNILEGFDKVIDFEEFRQSIED